MQQPRNGDKEATPPQATQDGRAEARPDAGGSADSTGWRRNFAIRLVTGLPALAAVLAVVALAPVKVVALLVAAAGVYGTHEYVRLARAGAAVLPARHMLLAGAMVGLGGMAGTAVALNAGLLAGALLVLWRVWFAASTDGRDALRDLGVALAGLLLIPWLLGHLSLLVQLPGGRVVLALLLLVATFNDSAAYLVGRFFGRHLLLPAVSPKKTVEGAVGGVCGGLLAGLLIGLLVGSPDGRWLGEVPLGLSVPTLAVLGAVLAMAGQAGDLVESKFKRLTHAGDSGRFLPGHGGLLDRVDVFLLAGPLAYYLLVLLGH